MMNGPIPPRLAAVRTVVITHAITVMSITILMIITITRPALTGSIIHSITGLTGALSIIHTGMTHIGWTLIGDGAHGQALV